MGKEASAKEERRRIPELCGNCQHWHPHGNNPSFGQCRLSLKAMQAPLVTTDRASCTQWTVAERLGGSR